MLGAKYTRPMPLLMQLSLKYELSQTGKVICLGFQRLEELISDLAH